ncbi:MAG: hypothetical protein H3C57_07510 [Gammaproteobacteria bacterium]|nr:hypothetical protein [Gammaproteobacteria bacterium]
MPSPATRGRRGLAAGALAMGGLVTSLLTPAHALTLGNVAVDSALGQPLSARIPVELAAGEMLSAACVSVPTPAHPDLGALPRAEVRIPEVSGAGRFALHITTSQALYEPMYELQVQVRCNGMPLLLRQYVLMLDLPGIATAATATSLPAAAPASGTAAPATRTVPANTRRPAAASRAASRTAPIPADAPYRVAAGDTLLGIAARVEGRQGRTLWQMAEGILAANPEAFIGNNPDLIKLGSLILIPGGDALSLPASDPASAVRPLTTPSLPSTGTAAATPATSADATASIALPASSEAVATPAASAADTTPPASVEAGADATTTDLPQSWTPPVGTDAGRVFVDEVSDAQAMPAAAPQASVAADAANNTGKQGAPAWLAALIGILIGAALSLALLRERLVAALGGLARRSSPVAEATEAPAPAAAAPAPAAPLSFKTAPAPQEATMVVEEHPADDATEELMAVDEASVTVEHLVPSAVPLDDTADDLASLFDQEPDLPLPARATDDGAAAADLDLDLSADAADDTPDEDISWIGDETALTPTMHAAALPDTGRSDTVEQIDLQTLAQQVSDDPAISQTLKEALALLESDYEEEMTASQLLDQHKLESLLDEGDLEDTLVRTGTDFPRRR